MRGMGKSVELFEDLFILPERCLCDNNCIIGKAVIYGRTIGGYKGATSQIDFHRPFFDKYQSTTTSGSDRTAYNATAEKSVELGPVHSDSFLYSIILIGPKIYLLTSKIPFIYSQFIHSFFIFNYLSRVIHSVIKEN